MATPLEVIRAAQSTTGGSGDRRGPRHSASARRSQVLFISTHFHLLQAHLLSGIPLLGEKRQEVEEGPASPRVQGHTGITTISDGEVWVPSSLSACLVRSLGPDLTPEVLI